MKGVSLLIRGFGFWIAVFNTFALAWSTWSLSSLPVELPHPLAAFITFLPVIALLFGALMPDQLLSESGAARMSFVILVAMGMLGATVVATNSLMFFQGPNMSGFWFQVIVAAILAALLSRLALVPRQVSRK